MNPSTEKALARVLDRLSRPPKQRRGISRAPLMLGAGFLVGFQLLVRLLPRVWGELLPGGLAGASRLRGWPGLLYAAARFCYEEFPVASGTLVSITVASFLLCWWWWPFRWLSWLLAIAVLAADALILMIILRTALVATAGAAGF
jgi:hypothetical protein